MITGEQEYGNFITHREKLSRQDLIIMDRPDGIWKWYYENNAILREEEYFQGKRDGSYTEYSINGEIITQGQYSDGEKNGEWKYKSGDNTEEGKYIIGLKGWNVEIILS